MRVIAEVDATELDSVVNKDLTSLDPVSAPPTPPLPLFSSLHL